MMTHISAEQALGFAVAAARGVVSAFALVIVVVGMVISSTAITLYGRWVEFA